MYLRKLIPKQRVVPSMLAKHEFYSHFNGIRPSKSMEVRKSIPLSLWLAKHVYPIAMTRNTNMFFSPSSIQVLLGLITAGSNGPTHDQLLSFLTSKSTDEVNYRSSKLFEFAFSDASDVGGPVLSAATSLWVDQSLNLKPSFRWISDNVYKVASVSVDFKTKASEVVNQVNRWAKMETRGLIKEVLSANSINHETKLVFANSLYFKGAWDGKFDASMTEDHEFHLLNGTSVQVPFMTNQTVARYVKRGQGFKVLRLPYKQGKDRRRFSMYFFLPDANNGLPELVEKVTSDPQFLDRHLPFRQVMVNEFRIPKFKVSFGFDVSKVLKELGLVLPFSGHDLTEMVNTSDSHDLDVSSIFQGSFIEVNEEGTEHPSDTCFIIRPMAGGYFDRSLEFVADHPFLFQIREDATGVVLFAGSVLNPLSE